MNICEKNPLKYFCNIKLYWNDKQQQNYTFSSSSLDDIDGQSDSIDPSVSIFANPFVCSGFVDTNWNWMKNNLIFECAKFDSS